jgi:hypothetical protein
MVFRLAAHLVWSSSCLKTRDLSTLDAPVQGFSTFKDASPLTINGRFGIALRDVAPGAVQAISRAFLIKRLLFFSNDKPKFDIVVARHSLNTPL